MVLTGFTWVMWSPQAGYYEQDNTLQGLVQGGEFTSQLRNY